MFDLELGIIVDVVLSEGFVVLSGGSVWGEVGCGRGVFCVLSSLFFLIGFVLL